jgi:superfamily II DNA/RNA helicase
VPQHAPIASAPTTFAALGVPTPLVEALAREGIVDAFPIQAATLPDSLQGRDVLGRGRTGSGKTLAFSLATLNTLLASEGRRTSGAPRALVLVPTRELAQQVADVMTPLARTLRFRVSSIYGGVGYGPQLKAMRDGVDLIIATPGRLEDLIARGSVRLDRIEATVLDEADHMADLGFLPAVTRILDATPKHAQRLLFSATLDGGVGKLVTRYLHNPVTHEVDSGDADVPVMTHHVFTVNGGDKAEVVRQLVAGEGRTVAFTRTKHGAKNLARRLTAAGIPAVDLHGNLSQSVRQKNLNRFSTGRVRVLVATDIAARGIHVDDVNLVVHVDPPAEHKAYVHRSGRTARAGNEGVVVTVATHHENGDVKTLMKRAGIKPVMRPITPGHAAIAELVGPTAALVMPSTMPVVEPDRPARSQRPRRPSGSRQGQSAQGQSRASGSRPAKRTNERSGERTGSPNGTSRQGRRPQRSNASR